MDVARAMVAGARSVGMEGRVLITQPCAGLGAHVIELDDVESEFGFHQTREVATLHGKHGVLESFDHGPLGEIVEVTARGSRAGVFGLRLGHFSKSLGCLAQFVQQGLCARACLGLVVCRGALVHLDQDMTGAPLFGLGVAGQLVLVVLPGFVCRHHQAFAQACGIQHHILNIGLLHRLED